MSNSQISSDNIFVKGYRLQIIINPNNQEDQRVVLQSIDVDGNVKREKDRDSGNVGSSMQVL